MSARPRSQRCGVGAGVGATVGACVGALAFSCGIASVSSASSSALACPPGLTHLDNFTAEGDSWLACEDLQVAGGGIALVRAGGESVWLTKTHEPYTQGADEEYYLGLGKHTVLGAKWDMLGDSLLEGCPAGEKSPTTGLCEPTWQRVERAVPVMRYSQGNKQASGNAFMCSPYGTETGVRTFTGSRGASVDAAFSDHADDCTDNGFPRPQGYVMNLTAIAHGEPPIPDFLQYVNFSGMADGMVDGARSPNLVFYFPILRQNFSAFGGSRYWSMVASPVPDMQGGREQSVWFRFQQLVCDGAHGAPPCALHGDPQYYDTYWYSFSPVTTRWIRPELMANASGFYANLLAVRRYWDRTLEAEGMMALSLPSGGATNGTWLAQQATGSIVRSMISRDDTWHGRYGVLPGYGVSLQDGFQDTFTASATGALEMGAFPYARGVIDNWLRYYVRANGMTTYRAEELAQSGRMLSIFALYVSMTGDSALLLAHYDKARVLAQWLLYRYEASLKWPEGDPRRGIVEGGDEGDGFPAYYETYGETTLQHMYSCSANVYRGFADIGAMWTALGKQAGRDDVVAHGQELLAVVPAMLDAIRTSLNATIKPSPGANKRGAVCVPSGADPAGTHPGGAPGSRPLGCLGDFRGYNELMYAGVLSAAQADAMFTHLMYGNESDLGTRPMTLGACGYNNKQTTYTAYGMAYGLLQHDFVERFLLHWFGMSAHTYTRGTWTTPEAAHPDRDVGSTDYVAAGVMTAPTYLKWALLFEEPNAKEVWLAKATPREWLGAGSPPIAVANATSRYGRVSYTLEATQRANQPFQIKASVTLPPQYAATATAPPGGVVLRLRTPVQHAGKLSSVTVGGKAWAAFDAQAETIKFAQLTPALLKDLEHIVATY